MTKAMRSRVCGSKLPDSAMPWRPRKAFRASGEWAKTLRKFGTMPSLLWIASSSAFYSVFAVSWVTTVMRLIMKYLS